LSDADEPLILSDLISRVLDKGVVLSGDVLISIADIDLIKLELHLLVSGVETAIRRESDVPVLPDGPPGA
jgi:gas vesicle structural protein